MIKLQIIAKLFTFATATKNPRNPRIKHERFACALLGAEFTFRSRALIPLRTPHVQQLCFPWKLWCSYWYQGPLNTKLTTLAITNFNFIKNLVPELPIFPTQIFAPKALRCMSGKFLRPQNNKSYDFRYFYLCNRHTILRLGKNTCFDLQQMIVRKCESSHLLNQPQTEAQHFHKVLLLSGLVACFGHTFL